MKGLEERGVLTQRTRGLETHRASDARGLVSKDVTEGILRHDDVEVGGFGEHSHRGIVDKHIVGVHLGILRFHLLGYLAPQTTGSQHIGLIDDSEVLTARHGHLEGHLQDALNLRTGVDVCIVGLVVILIFLTEIHAARKFTDDHEVGATQQFVLQR